MQVDRAGWHDTEELIIPENIRLILQPAYSPELNPVGILSIIARPAWNTQAYIHWAAYTVL
jgi:hypothetical protein